MLYFAIFIAVIGCLKVSLSADIFEALQPAALKENLPFLVDMARSTPLSELSNMPIIHHAFNLYFGSNSLDERKVLVAMLKVLIDRGVDVNAKSGQDPDIIFKAIVLREMGLAKKIASAG